MPSNVVDTKKDEEKWEKAKGIAEERGHGGEWDYVMGIYKRMNPDHEFKSSSFRRVAGLDEGEVIGLVEDLLEVGVEQPLLRSRIRPILDWLTDDSR